MSKFTIFGMQQNLQTNSSLPQTVKPEVTFIKITPTHGYPSQHTGISPSFSFYKIICTHPILLKSNNERNFINQLIISLQQSPHFQYLVHLYCAPLQWLGVNKTTSKLSCCHFITYCSIMRIDEVQEKMIEIQNEFRQRCLKMNSILAILKQKYKIQTKISFWVKRFNDLLQQSQLEQIKHKQSVKKKLEDLLSPSQNPPQLIANPTEQKELKH